MAKAFISYSHRDEEIVNKFHSHLAQLKRQGDIEVWYDRDILAGNVIEDEILLELKSSDIFISIVSPDYLSSSYCYEKEFLLALELHRKGEIKIIPIISDHCDWLNSPFKDFKAVPLDGKPIRTWTNENAAYLNIVSELRRIVNSTSPAVRSVGSNLKSTQQSRNYKVERDFTDVDLVNFLNESFRTIKQFFEDSIHEIATVDEIQAVVTNVEKDSFTCLISNRAKVNSNGYITVFIANKSFRRENGISYTLSQYRQENALEFENLFTIENDSYNLFWVKQSLYGTIVQRRSWTAKEIAEKFWSLFIQQVGISEGD